MQVQVVRSLCDVRVHAKDEGSISCSSVMAKTWQEMSSANKNIWTCYVCRKKGKTRSPSKLQDCEFKSRLVQMDRQDLMHNLAMLLNKKLNEQLHVKAGSGTNS